LEVADDPTGLLDQEQTGSNVPWVKTILPIAVEPAGRRIGQVKSGCAGASYALTAPQYVRDSMTVVVGVCPTVIWKTGRQEGIGKGVGGRDLKLLPIEVCATALLCREAPIAKWLCDDGYKRSAL
tara:strand:- start:138 stop:512 length:375 start_codon:yes stop_codon:yes gene_type:complete